MTETELIPGAVRVGKWKAIWNIRDRLEGRGASTRTSFRSCSTSGTIPGERYDRFMNGWAEKTWEAPQMGARALSLLPTYKKYPNRPVQTAGLSGALFVADDAQVQQQVHKLMHAIAVEQVARLKKPHPVAGSSQAGEPATRVPCGETMSTDDPLPSWRDGAPKTAILEFVRSVSEPGGSFVPAPERVATFDNDGTLWCEKPTYVQAYFLMARWKEMVEADPSKAKQQPYKALVEKDQTWLAHALDHVPELIKGVTEAYDAITIDAFEDAVHEFFATAKHPTLGVPYTQVGYRPMRELISLLHANEFTVYICSAGGRDFVRPVSEEMYGLPRECVIGSATTLEYRDGDVYRTKGVEQPIDDGPGKPVHIWTQDRSKAAARRRQRRRRRRDARDRALRAADPSRRSGARVRLRRRRRARARRGDRSGDGPW